MASVIYEVHETDSYLTNVTLVQVRSESACAHECFYGTSACSLEKVNVTSVKQVWMDGRRKGCWITPLSYSQQDALHCTGKG